MAHRNLKILDLTGQVFGKLTAIRKVKHGPRNHMLWQCSCECGNTAFVLTSDLVDRKQISCGCGRLGYRNLEGKKFSKLTVLSQIPQRLGITGHGDHRWKCLCDCGNETETTSNRLVSGHTQSCGCMRNEYAKRKRPDRRLPTYEYAIAKVLDHYRYAAAKRGLSFDLTRQQALAFMAMDCHYCGRPPSNLCKEHLEGAGAFSYNGIDRSDNTKGYTLSNCVPCRGICNKAKGRIPPAKFRDWLSDVAWHQVLAAPPWRRYRGPQDEPRCQSQILKEQSEAYGHIAHLPTQKDRYEHLLLKGVGA